MNNCITEWIAVDWGTSNLRVWAMQGDVMLDRAQSGAGMAGLARDGFGPALSALIDGWDVPLATPVIAVSFQGSNRKHLRM